MKSAGFEHAARFSWSASAARVREIYSEVVQAPRRADLVSTPARAIAVEA
jgi:hypothetical protein